MFEIGRVAYVLGTQQLGLFAPDSTRSEPVLADALRAALRQVFDEGWDHGLIIGHDPSGRSLTHIAGTVPWNAFFGPDYEVSAPAQTRYVSVWRVAPRGSWSRPVVPHIDFVVDPMTAQQLRSNARDTLLRRIGPSVQEALQKREMAIVVGMKKPGGPEIRKEFLFEPGPSQMELLEQVAKDAVVRDGGFVTRGRGLLQSGQVISDRHVQRLIAWILTPGGAGPERILVGALLLFVLPLSLFSQIQMIRGAMGANIP